jgi:hypothetical protein
MSKPTAEYYEAKVQLCEKLAMQQIFSGNTEMGMQNIMRAAFAQANKEMLPWKEQDNG